MPTSTRSGIRVINAIGKRCPYVILAARDEMRTTHLAVLMTDDPVGPRDVRLWCKKIKVVTVLDETLKGTGTMHMTLKRD